METSYVEKLLQKIASLRAAENAPETYKIVSKKVSRLYLPKGFEFTIRLSSDKQSIIVSTDSRRRFILLEDFLENAGCKYYFVDWLYVRIPFNQKVYPTMDWLEHPHQEIKSNFLELAKEVDF